MVLNDLYTDAMNGGIFTDLNSFDVPWKQANIPKELDTAYHYNHSGMKRISPLLSAFVSDGALSAVSRTEIAKTIFTIYGKKWDELWETLSYTYNPIENYSMTETMSGTDSTAYGKTVTRTANLSTAKTGTDTITPNVTTTGDSGIHGFNVTGDPVAADFDTASTTGTNTTQYNTTVADTGTDTNAETGSDTVTKGSTVTRSGNIGVTTTQQMIQSQRDLLMWEMFQAVVFPDVDSLLTLKIY